MTEQSKQVLTRNFCIIAHIDHGKSTLADRLLEYTETLAPKQMQDQVLDNMDLERERGITIKAHAVHMQHRAPGGEEYAFNLIDTPGHVDFAYEVSRSLAACEGALLVVDATQGVEAQTVSNLLLAMGHDLVVIPCINKIDMPGAQVDSVHQQITDLIGAGAEEEVICISAKEGIGIEEVTEAIVDRVPPPTGVEKGPLRALIFDSLYDQYRGVICFIRVVDGEIRKGGRIRFHSTGMEYEVEEIGRLRIERIPCDSLQAGGCRVPDCRGKEALRSSGRGHRFRLGSGEGRSPAGIHATQTDGIQRGIPGPPGPTRRASGRAGSTAIERRRLHVRT